MQSDAADGFVGPLEYDGVGLRRIQHRADNLGALFNARVRPPARGGPYIRVAGIREQRLRVRGVAHLPRPQYQSFRFQHGHEDSLSLSDYHRCNPLAYHHNHVCVLSQACDNTAFE